MAKFVPFATAAVDTRPYSEGYMWVDKETGKVRFDIDGQSIYATSPTPSIVDYSQLENTPIKYATTLEELQAIFETTVTLELPLYFMWKGETQTIDDITLCKGGIYFASSDTPPTLIAGGSGTATDSPIIVEDSLATPSTPLVDDTYYLNKAASSIQYTENPTEPTEELLSKLYFNEAISVEEIGAALGNLPWDTVSVQTMDSMQIRIMPLWTEAEPVETDGSLTATEKGLYVLKMTSTSIYMLGSLYYIYSGYPTFDGGPRFIFVYSPDFGASSVDMPKWGWIDYANENLNPTPPIELSVPFTFNYMFNKEHWDSWLSTSDEFASAYELEANTLYRYAEGTFGKLDGKAIQPVDSIPGATKAYAGQVIYNKQDNKFYECNSKTVYKTADPITVDSIMIPEECVWDSCAARYISVNMDLSTEAVAALLTADSDSSGATTIITASDSCGAYNRNLFVTNNDGHVQLIDSTDSCAPRVIFDNTLDGWQIITADQSVATENGWYLPDTSYFYPRYKLKSNTYCKNLDISSKSAPYGCLFSTATPEKAAPIFAACKSVSSVYVNVNKVFDSRELFGDSRYPYLDVAMLDTTTGKGYHWLFSHGSMLSYYGDTATQDPGWIIVLAGEEDETYNLLYAEKAFDWTGIEDLPPLSAAEPGWQPSYIDLSTGQLKLPVNGVLQPVSGAIFVEVESDNPSLDPAILGEYISGTPFEAPTESYQWHDLAATDEVVTAAGTDYRIIQHTTEGDLTITEANGAENVIVMGTVRGYIYVEESLKTLTYIGDCSDLTVDFSALVNSSAIPIVSLIGSGEAKINGNRFRVSAQSDVTVRELSQSSGSPYRNVHIETPGDVRYYLASTSGPYDYQPLTVSCDYFYLYNENNYDPYSLRRNITAACENIRISGNTAFLENEYNKYNTTTGVGSRLTVNIPMHGDGCHAYSYAGPGSTIKGTYLFAEPDACNSSVYNRQWLTIQDYVDEKIDNAGSGSSASSSPNPTVLARSNGPVDAYDTCSTYGAMYLNRFFADNFDSNETFAYTLLQGDGGGDMLDISYTAHTPSSLHIYVYDGSYGADMSGGIAEEIYKDGAWVINPDTYTLKANSGSWKVNSSLSEIAARVVQQLLSATTKNGTANYTASAANAWTYTPLADVSDSVVPPNIREDGFMRKYSADTSILEGLDGRAGGLYQCVWVGKLTWGDSEHDVRVAFRPIWTTWCDYIDGVALPGPTVFTSESIYGNTLTLISTSNTASYYPQLKVVLNDGTTEPNGTLYWKRLYK